METFRTSTYPKRILGNVFFEGPFAKMAVFANRTAVANTFGHRRF